MHRRVPADNARWTSGKVSEVVQRKCYVTQFRNGCGKVCRAWHTFRLTTILPNWRKEGIPARCSGMKTVAKMISAPSRRARPSTSITSVLSSARVASAHVYICTSSSGCLAALLKSSGRNNPSILTNTLRRNGHRCTGMATHTRKMKH